MNKSKILRITAFFLVLVLLLCTVGWGVSQSRVEPDNPIETDVDELKVDISKTSGASDSIDDQTDLSEQQENDDNEKESEEEQEESETETETETESETQEETEESDEGETDDALPPETETGDAENGDDDNTSNDQDESGDTPTEGGDGDTDISGPGGTGDNEPGLVTDLYSRVITFSELTDDKLKFYVYYSDPTVDADIKVTYKLKNDTGNGETLYSRNNRNYEVELSLGQNYITIFFTNNDGERTYTRYIITYQADKANADNPEIGEHPPVIQTNLDDQTEPINVPTFKFVVKARTWQNKTIYKENIEVRLDGVLIMNPTGSGTYEYTLEFERSSDSDLVNHEVSVLAWDNEGNSRYVIYKLQHEMIDEGDALGVVTVVIDATIVNCGRVDTITVNVNSGDTAATAVLAALDEGGYSYEFAGIPEYSTTVDFYLRGLSRADAFRGCKIDDRIYEMLKRGGVSFTSAGTRDRLREHDFTYNSGWVYSVNGHYPGQALNKWTVSGNETIVLRFTLDHGKDLGLGGNYCFTASSIGAITEHADRHDFQEVERVEPVDGAAGYVLHECSRCGLQKQEALESPDESETSESETDPPETDPPETDPPETDPPETESPETDPPQTDPPQTDSSQTDPLQTDQST